MRSSHNTIYPRERPRKKQSHKRKVENRFHIKTTHVLWADEVVSLERKEAVPAEAKANSTEENVDSEKEEASFVEEDLSENDKAVIKRAKTQASREMRKQKHEQKLASKQYTHSVSKTLTLSLLFHRSVGQIVKLGAKGTAAVVDLPGILIENDDHSSGVHDSNLFLTTLVSCS